MPLRPKHGKWLEASWFVIWCHDQHRKKHMRDRWGQLLHAAKEVGASFWSSSKTEQYMAWLATRCSPSYLLLTTYREAKPTLQVIREQGTNHNLLGIVILADSDSILRRARAWAMSQECPPIWVLPQFALEELRILLSCCKDKVLQAQSSDVTNAGSFNGVQGDPSQVQVPWNMWPVVPINRPAEKTAFMDPAATVGSAQQAPMVRCSYFPCEWAPMGAGANVCTSTHAGSVGGTRSVPNVLSSLRWEDLMGAVQHEHTAVAIHQKLAQSMPEVYED